MEIRLSLWFLLCLAFFSCGKDNQEPINKNRVDITLSQNEVKVGEIVSFKIESYSSEIVSSVLWEFGDLNTSNEKEANHTYEKPGYYNVTALLSFSNGDSYKVGKSIYVYYSEIVIRQSIEEKLKSSEILVCGHRGFGEFAAENSLTAFSQAIENSIDMIEIDVRATKDKKLVLMHDATIDRTTNGRGKISELNYSELASLLLYNGEELTTNKIPLLADVLELVRGKVYIDIDVKSDCFKETYELVKQYGMINQVIFTVYDSQSNKLLLNIDSDLLIMPIIYEMKDLENHLTINPSLKIAQFNSSGFTTDIVEKAHSKDVSIFKNIYVNTSKTPTSDNYKEVNDFLNKGGKIVQTDHPVEIKSYLNRK